MYTYELWDIESNHLIDWFNDEELLRQAISEWPNFDGVALARRDQKGATTWLNIAAYLEQFTPAPTPAAIA